MTPKLLAAAFVAALVAATSVGAAFARSTATHASVKSGTWAGTIENQELSFAEGSYTTKIVVQALRGRVTWVVATVRMECPETSVWDAKVSKIFKPGTGPKLSPGGGFFASIPTVAGAFSKAGATVKVSGALRPAGASGTASARGDGCSGKGSWKAKKIH